MEVSVREFKSQLSHYLHLAEEGGEVVVTSRHRQIVRLMPCEAGSGELPSIPGVRWKTPCPDLSKSIAKRPINMGEPLSDWVAANRR